MSGSLIGRKVSFKSNGILNIHKILFSRYIAVGADDSSVRVLHYDQASTFRIGTVNSIHIVDAVAHLKLSIIIPS